MLVHFVKPISISAGLLVSLIYCFNDVTLKLYDTNQIKAHMEYFYCDLCEYKVRNKTKFKKHKWKYHEYNI